uniref:Apolipoprotein A-V n=1 Tax=Pavo cristatus TaxID=9049 RepID=A0A8C9EGT3_PAVCR
MKPKSIPTPHPHSTTPAALCFPKLCSVFPGLWAAPITSALLLAVSPAELARSGFWEYLSQLTSDKDSLEQAQGSKLGRDNVGNFLEKLAPLNRGIQPRLYHDSDSLRKLIRKELESLRVKLSPYVDDVHHRVGKHLEDLRYQLRNVAIAFHTDQVKDIFQPYADRLVSEIQRSVEELHRNVVPHSPASPEQLNQHIRELSAKLTQNARDLHRNIQRNLEQLKAKLSLRPSGPGERYALEMASEVQRRIEEFRRDTYLQIQDFTRAVHQETEDMRLKLSSRPHYPEEAAGSPAPLEDLRASLDALWRDLSHSLSERGGDAP